MLHTYTLLLGSKSASRSMLLQEMQLPFIRIEQPADETRCDWTLPINEVVAGIARYKMAQAVVPASCATQPICFVLTADTLCKGPTGKLHGKPVDRADAIAKITEARQGISLVATAFCLEKKRWQSNGWVTEQRIEKVVNCHYIFSVPDSWIDTYLEKSSGLLASGAIAIEGFGGQFLQVVNGSYTAIVGLPLYELREALEQIGFFE